MTEDFQGNETTPYNTIMVDECHFDVRFSSVQSLSHVRLFVNQQTAAHQASLSFTISWSLFKRMSIVGDAIQASHPLSSPSPPALSLSQHQGLF